MKNNRQEKILAIIEAEPIETQEQLLSKLQEQGIESTQATISRGDPHGARLLKKKIQAVKSLERRYERERENQTQRPNIE